MAKSNNSRRSFEECRKRGDCQTCGGTGTLWAGKQSMKCPTCNGSGRA
jgi:DnaJ-class molecular chaperone